MKTRSVSLWKLIRGLWVLSGYCTFWKQKILKEQLFLWKSWGFKTLTAAKTLLVEEPAATIWARRVGSNGLMFGVISLVTGLVGFFWTNCMLSLLVISSGGLDSYHDNVVTGHHLNQNLPEPNNASKEWPYCPYLRSSSRGHHLPHPRPSQIMEPRKGRIWQVLTKRPSWQ